MIELFLSSFTIFFVLIDPPGCAPIYASLTTEANNAQRRSMAMRAVIVAALILLVFALFGEQLLATLHIELDSFRIAGGLMLFVIAIEMVFEKRTARREERAQKIIDRHDEGQPEIDDVSIFPMAMPMLAGPGSIAAIMLLMSQNEGWESTAVILGAMVLVLVITFFALWAAGPIMRLLGDKAEAVITRLLGVLLTALAAQFVIDGLRGSFNLPGGPG